MKLSNFRFARMLILALAAASVFVSACKFAGTDRAIPYSHLATIVGADPIEEPFGVAFRDGFAYFSDGEHGTIRKIGVSDDAVIIAEGLQTPSAIAFLPSGELLVAETGSHTIKKISVDGTISVFAGSEGALGSSDGSVASAKFNAPVGVAVGSDGVVYVADTYNDRIRVIRDGVVSTLAGGRRGFADGIGTAASFDTPLGIAVSGEKILVADSGNARVRVIESDGSVSTLVGGPERDRIDGTLATARLVDPRAIAVDERGVIFVADGDAVRVIGRRSLPFVETLRRSVTARLERPSGLAIGPDSELFIADSDNGVVRVLSDGSGDFSRDRSPSFVASRIAPPPLATRWPFEPGDRPREIAGTLGEVRGEVPPKEGRVWFHNGLDIAGGYGERAVFIRDEAVLDPHSANNFGTSRELLRMPWIGYIHLRLGRDKDDRVFEDPRFQFERDASGKLIGLRVPRGARFAAGDAIGTLNSMNHVHLVAGRRGHEINALKALQLPGIRDSIAPVIEDVKLFDAGWNAVEGPTPQQSRIVVRAYDRMDGNSERRRLGVCRLGFQLFSNGNPIGKADWRIGFDYSPSSDSVLLAYAPGSQSGYTGETVFNYIVTNHVNGVEEPREDFLDISHLAPGTYTLRVFASDYFGNVSSGDVEIRK